MQQQIENPMVSGFTPALIKPLYICPTCGAAIYDCANATINEQMSASRQYCEDCIDKLDTPENRYRWLVDNDLQAKFLEWFFTGSNDCYFGADDRASAKMWVGMWQGCKKHRDELDGHLKEYIDNESGYAYTQWLLDTN